MAVLDRSGVEVTQGAKVRCLAASWARHDYKLAEILLSCKDKFNLREVLKALTLLDSGREERALEKRLKRLDIQKAKPTKKGKVKNDLDNIRKEIPKVGSVSGALVRHVNKWVSTIPEEDMEFFALFMPKEPWKKLADILHLHPQKHQPQCPWFLPFCYGKDAPPNTLVAQCANMTSENVSELVMGCDVPYSHVRKHATALSVPAKARIASYTKDLDTLLWYFEELDCKEVHEIIDERLGRGDTIKLPYGKLMERMLYFHMLREGINPEKKGGYFSSRGSGASAPVKVDIPFFPKLIPIADCRLRESGLPLEQPVAVFGDASSSMQVAIRTSTIVASLFCAMCGSSNLTFFDQKLKESPLQPETIEGVLEVSVKVTASGSTAPAACLYPYFEKKQIIKTFVIVTDEEENTASNGYKFCPLFKEYYETVYPAKLVFVSFLRSQHQVGQMVKELKALNMNPMQFVFNQARPDLTKLDHLLGLLASSSVSFNDEVVGAVKELKNKGLESLQKYLQ
eukprot:TRINITY_DN15629_c0_g1_i1.p1 TRINITY_DN15629_c0_g1~~TRINITY_DN15629_c0_g1_i1.p1  ORF type:complete len:581 (+),score=124.63 TRINITY_DN15629_c0_g1_i1:210-1745(+)